MRHLLELDTWVPADIENVFGLAREYAAGGGPRFDGAAALFFPASSLRTRVTFERGLAVMGLQPILFPPETLDKSEALTDVASYLAQWCDIAVVRHDDLATLTGLAAADALPVVNAMTSVNHPCEVLSDLFAISELGRDITALRYVFVGADGNIGRGWAEAARALDLDLIQSCPPDIAIAGVELQPDLDKAIAGADVILTDPPGRHAEALAAYRITAAHLALAAEGHLLNPCPPFVRDREVAADVINTPGAWVGHQFKHALLPVQQAIVAMCLGKP
jgi:ornithine carbamoyltransferase